MMISYIPQWGSCRSLNLLNHSNFTHDFPKSNIIRGISSNGRAPALHAGGTGIDTWILQDQCLCMNGNNFLAFSFFFGILSSSFISSHKTRVVCQDVLHKINALHLLWILLPRFLCFTLYLQQSRKSKITTLECLMTRVM